MRLWNALKRLASETAMLTIAIARQIGRPKMMIAAAAVAILAAFVIWEASADVALPGRPVSNRAGAAW